MQTVTVLTINTGKGDGPFATRLPVLAHAIGTIDPDVILAQEVFEAVAGQPSTALLIAEATGMASAFHALRRKPREVEGTTLDSWSGLATYSRWPIREVTSRALEDDPADGDRAALFVAVETPGGLLRTCNTHLTHLRHRDDLRERQVSQILGDAWWERAAEARLLGGDLNARPEARLHGLIRSELGWEGVDAYEETGDPTAAATIRHETSQGVVEARVDYLYLLTQPGDTPAISVEAARVVLDRPVDGVMPSDHFGVLATLRWAV